MGAHCSTDRKKKKLNNQPATHPSYYINNQIEYPNLGNQSNELHNQISIENIKKAEEDRRKKEEEAKRKEEEDRRKKEEEYRKKKEEEDRKKKEEEDKRKEEEDRRKKEEEDRKKREMNKVGINLYLQNIKYVFRREDLEKNVNISVSLEIDNITYDWKMKDTSILPKLNQINTSDYFEPLNIESIYHDEELEANIKLSINTKVLSESKFLFEGKGKFKIGDFFKNKDSDIYSWNVPIFSKKNDNIEKDEDYAEINFFGNLKKLDEKEIRRQKQSRFYDLILAITSFEQLNEGWEIQKFRGGIDKLEEKDLLVVNFYGHFSSGKTFALDRIITAGLPEGDDVNTEGASLKYVSINDFGHITFNPNKICKTYLFMDLAGFNFPMKIINKEDLNMKLLGIDFLRRMAFNYSDVVIYVCGRMTISEKIMIQNIPILFKEIKAVFIIHNFKNENEESTVTKLLKQQIEDQFEVEINHEKFEYSDENGNNMILNCTYYKGGTDSQPLFHFYLVDENSNLGKKLNSSTFSCILRNFILIKSEKKQPFIPFVADELEKYIKGYALKNNNYKDKIVEFSENKIKLRDKIDPKHYKLINEDEMGNCMIDSNIEYVCFNDGENQKIVVDIFTEFDPGNYEIVKAEYSNLSIKIKINKKQFVPEIFLKWKNENFDLLDNFHDETFNIMIEIRKEDINNGSASLKNEPELKYINEKKIIRFEFKYIFGKKKGPDTNFRKETGKSVSSLPMHHELEPKPFPIPEMKNREKLDLVVFVNTIEDIFVGGAKIILNKKISEKKFYEKFKSKFIGIISDSNVRKLDVINLIIKKAELVHEINCEQFGRLCFMTYENYTFVYYDPASELTIHNGSHSDSIKLNKIFLNLINDICAVIIYVTHHITRSQMIYLSKLEDYLKTKSSNKKLIVIHYFNTFTDQNLINKKIKECIIEPYENVKEDKMITTTYISTPHWTNYYQTSERVLHLIMCADSNLKNYYNLKLVDYLKLIIDSNRSFEFSYSDLFDILKDQLLTEDDKVALEFDIKNGNVKFVVDVENKKKFFSNFDQRLMSYTPKYYIASLCNMNNDNFNEEEHRIAVFNTSSSKHWKLGYDVIHDSSNFILKLFGSRIRNDEYDGFLIIKDERKYGKININEPLCKYVKKAEFREGESDLDEWMYDEHLKTGKFRFQIPKK
jgi:hypothetical protein